MFEGGGFDKRVESEKNFWTSEAKEFKADVKSQNTWIIIIVGSVGTVTLLAIGYFFLEYKKRVREELNKQVETTNNELLDKIENVKKQIDIEHKQMVESMETEIIGNLAKIAEASPEQMKKIILTQKEDVELKNTTSIAVIMSSDESKDFLKRFFSNYKFNENKIKYFNENNYREKIDEVKQQDVLLIYNQDTKLSEQAKEIEEYILLSGNLSCFYFGKNIRAEKGIDNFANSPATLYIQFLALLRHKKLMLD
ncbi:MAG: hypothetical protein COZ18_02600 [Flexibacter sp. CG_4_10_14_3_um_filter_32_15]|nr:MAG: hypothetical protein COZ18_02600 [Flexibacter sp. CG_4_10_14_3_um_filter_32_15]